MYGLFDQERFSGLYDNVLIEEGIISDEVVLSRLDISEDKFMVL